MTAPALGVVTLVSGSSGNLALIRSPGANVLLDLGIHSQRGIVAALATQGIHPGALDAVLVSHAHTDHLDYPGLKLMVDQEVPLLMGDATRAAAERLFRAGRKRPLPADRCVALRTGTTYLVNDLEVTPFEVSHDVPTVGFRIEVQSAGRRRRLTVATDLGCAPEALIAPFLDADVVLIEANYNVEMLRRSRRHPDSKARVAGDRGHLSNLQAGTFLDAVVNASSHPPAAVVLVHLSEEHNTPALALAEVGGPLPWAKRHGTTILAAPRYRPGPVIEW